MRVYLDNGGVVAANCQKDIDFIIQYLRDEGMTSIRTNCNDLITLHSYYCYECQRIVDKRDYTMCSQCGRCCECSPIYNKLFVSGNEYCVECFDRSST